MNNFLDEQSQRLLRLAATVEARSRSIPGVSVLIDATRAYSEDRCSLLAAGLSYYALLSLFPLMLFILAIASQFGQSEEAIRAVTRFVSSYLPAGAVQVRTALEQVTRARGTLTLAGGLGFVWSASGVFDSIQLGLNRAFRVPSPRPMWRRRLFSIGMVFGASLLFALSFGTTTMIRLAIQYRVLERHDVLINVLPSAGGILLGIGVFAILYRYVPYDPALGWRDVWVSSLIAAVLWEMAKLAFTWYLTNYAVLNMVYGSLGTIIAIMIWGYVSAVILLIGAEIGAVLAGARRRAKTGGEWWALISP